MKNIDSKVIEDTVARLCIEANLRLPPDVINAIESAEKAEPWDGAKRILSLLGDNVRIASEKTLPVCQDTGMACVFVELGQDVHIDGDFEEAVNNGVRDFKGTVLFASHDHEFVQTIATRIIEIREKGVLDKECTYDEFLDFRETYKG